MEKTFPSRYNKVLLLKAFPNFLLFLSKGVILLLGEVCSSITIQMRYNMKSLCRAPLNPDGPAGFRFIQDKLDDLRTALYSELSNMVNRADSRALDVANQLDTLESELSQFFRNDDFQFESQRVLAGYKFLFRYTQLQKSLTESPTTEK